MTLGVVILIVLPIVVIMESDRVIWRPLALLVAVVISINIIKFYLMNTDTEIVSSSFLWFLIITTTQIVVILVANSFNII